MDNKGLFGNLFNIGKKQNAKIENMISADQNTENLKNEILGNTNNNLPTFDRPNIVSNPVVDGQTVAPATTPTQGTSIPEKEQDLSQPLSIPTPTEKPAEPLFPFAQPEEDKKPKNEALALEAQPGSVRIHNVDELEPEEDVMKKVDTLSGQKNVQPRTNTQNIKKRVRARGRKGALEVQTFNKLSIFLITFGLLVLISTGIYLFLSNQATKSGSNLVLGDVIQVRSELNYYSLMTLAAETNTTLPKKMSNSTTSGTTTTSRSSDLFVRVKIELTNKSTNAAAIKGYNKFYIVDSNYKILSECLTADDLKSYTVTDAFPSIVEGNKTVSGYLYCKSTVNTLPILQIISAKNKNQIASDGSISGDVNSYYVYLSKTKK